jgi:hypothetical protein
MQAPLAEYNSKTIREPRSHSGDATPPAAIVVLVPEDRTEVQVSEPPTHHRMRCILSNTRHALFMRSRRRRLQFRVSTQLCSLPMALVKLDPRQHGPNALLDALGAWMDKVGVSTPGSPQRLGESRLP